MIECWVSLVNWSMIYRQPSHGLEVVGAAEVHCCTDILRGRDRMALHLDGDLNGASRVVLPLHKDVLCSANTHEVGGRHHRPAEMETVPKPHAMKYFPMFFIYLFKEQ